MAIWDRLKDQAKALADKATSLIGETRGNIKSLLTSIDDRIDDIIPEIAEKATIAQREGLEKAEAIANAVEDEIKVLKTRIESAEREHNLTWRNDLLRKYATELNTTTSKLKSLLDKSGAMYSTAEAMERVIKSIANRTKDEAKGKLTHLKEELASAPEISTDLRLAANQILSGEKELIEVVLPESSKVLDRIKEEFGTPIGPGGEKVVIILPAAGLSKFVPNLGRRQADKVALGIVRHGTKKLRDFISKNPDDAARAFLKLPIKTQANVIGRLRNVPLGAQALSRLYDAVVKQTIKQMPLRERIVWRRILPKLPKWFLTVFALGVSTFGTVFMVGWLRKEAVEVVGIGAMDALRAKDYNEALRLGKLWLNFINTVDGELKTDLIDKFPLIGEFFRTNIKAQREAAESVIRRAEEGIAKAGPEPAILTITGEPVDANIYINGVFAGKLPFINQKIPSGVTRIDIRKDGYRTADLIEELDPGEAVEIEVNLKKLPDTFWDELEARRAADRKAYKLEQEQDGEVLVTSSPTAHIFIGGQDTGKFTPFTFVLSPGTYSIKLTANGFFDDISTAIIKPGIEVKHERILKPRDTTEREKTKAEVSISTNPSGAFVYINDIVQRYPSPIHVDLDPGTHFIKIEKKGYEFLNDVIEVRAGDTVPLTYDLTQLEAEPIWRLHVNSTPPGAKILIDGFFTGEWTPGFVDLLAGTYEVLVQKTGYTPGVVEINIP